MDGEGRRLSGVKFVPGAMIKPTSVTDPLGLQIRATYSNGQLAALSYPFKDVFVTNTFAYGTNGLLASERAGSLSD